MKGFTLGEKTVAEKPYGCSFCDLKFSRRGKKEKDIKNPFVQEFKKETVNMVQGIHESFDQEVKLILKVLQLVYLQN